MVKNVNVANAYKRRQEALELASQALEVIEDLHISLYNSKMGHIPSFSVLPIVTCKNCAECSKHCYACLGTFNFNKNVAGLAENTALVMYDVGRVEGGVNYFLNGRVTLYRYFRWNVAGDIFSLEYLEMMVRIALNNPLTTFLAYTKNYDLINDCLDSIDLPENLVIIFSKWGNAEFDNRHDLPVAIVKLDDDTEIPENAYHCSGDCSSCLECHKAKKGTVRYFDLH